MRWLIVYLLSLALLAQPPLASAQAEDWAATGSESDGSAVEKFVDLALCAVSIMAISTGVGATMAVLVCGKAAVTWWHE